MRRGRIYGALTAVVAALGVFAGTQGVARAASPQEICRAIASGQFNAAAYSQADLQAYVEAQRSNPTIQGYCSPLVILPPATTTVCVQQGPNGTTTPCGQDVAQTANGAAPAQAAGTVTVPTQGVAGASKVKQSPPATAAGSPTQQSAAPLATTRSSGSLPFTGAQLAVFALVGLTLLAGGFLLRMTARHKETGA
jgi:hypothetical protein